LNQEEIFNKIKGHLVDEFEIPPRSISMEADLFEDLGLDSIDALDMIAVLENELNKEIPEENLRKIRQVKHIVGFVQELISSS